jgi:MoaA/NifB/PqqE/SkfB family radical SAM enzyme
MKFNSAPINSTNSIPEATIIHGWRMHLVKFRIRIRIIAILLKKSKSLKTIKNSLDKILAIRKENMGNINQRKYAKIGRQYSWSTFAPPFPSAELDRLLNKEIDYALSGGFSPNPLHFIFLSITKKCPLNCEHCFEWDIMHRPEQLSLDDLKGIIQNFLDRGISSVFFSGGEPLSRYNDLVKLVKFASPFCKTWMFSSGYALDESKAQELKKEGLTGAIISIDHFEEEKHNAFRGNAQSFQRALKGVANVKRAGLVPALSVCVTKAFVTEENLLKYMDFAKGLGAVFVQFMEPVAEGKYKEKDVALGEDQLLLLNNFYRNFNGAVENVNYPEIIYQGYHQRKIGCHGGGKRFLYVDSDGDIQACPFCPKKMGTALAEPFHYEEGSCNQFAPSTI